ncbi:Ribonuclease h-like superfamily protein, partial [Thalictrum thalictroides]
MNLALLAKLWWKIILDESSLWSRTFKAIYPKWDLHYKRKAKAPGEASFFWKSLVKAAEVFRKGLVICIGNGESTEFWDDPWLLWQGKPTTIRGLCEMEMVEKLKVCEVIDRNAQQWDSQLLKEMVPEPVVNSILQIPIRHNSFEDSVKWNGSTNGAFSVKSAYALAMVEESSSSSGQELDLCFKKLWKLRIPASLQLFIWRVFNLALPVGEVLDKHHVMGDLECTWCNKSYETHDHLFFGCEWVKRVWFFSPVNMVVQDRAGWNWGQWFHQ